jgi:hypothetical protein
LEIAWQDGEASGTVVVFATASFRFFDGLDRIGLDRTPADVQASERVIQ